MARRRAINPSGTEEATARPTSSAAKQPYAQNASRGAAYVYGVATPLELVVNSVGDDGEVAIGDDVCDTGGTVVVAGQAEQVALPRPASLAKAKSPGVIGAAPPIPKNMVS